MCRIQIDQNLFYMMQGSFCLAVFRQNMCKLLKDSKRNKCKQNILNYVTTKVIIKVNIWQEGHNSIMKLTKYTLYLLNQLWITNSD